jgi:peptide/nickel transport system substrate-binding protein
VPVWSASEQRWEGLRTRRDFVKGTAVAGAAMGLSGILAACGGGSSGSPDPNAGSPATGAPRRGGRLRIADPGGGTTETLDPAVSVNLIDEMRDRQLYDTLTFFKEDWTIEYRLAESLEPNADASVWQLKLRSGVVFHDGKPLTADDVLYTWERVLDPKTASGGSAAISNIDLKRTKRISDTEIRIALKQPQIDLPHLLTGREQSIVQKGATDFSKPVGTGPFQFVSFTPGQRSLFKRNPNYWVQGEPYVDELEIISIPDATARTNALLGGQVDAIDNLPYIDAKTRVNDPNLKVHVTKDTGACMPWYAHLDVEPFKRPMVMEALKLAIDRPKVIESALAGFGTVGNDLFGKGTPSYNEAIPQRTYDPEKAKSLLKQAGVPDLKVTLNSSPTYVAVGMLESSQAYASQAKAAGIDITVKSWDGPKYTSDIYGKEPFAHTYWNYPAEIMFPEALAKGAPYNETHFVNPKFSSTYSAAEATVDAGKRKELYDELQQIQWNEGGYIVWCFIDFTDAASHKVQGVTKHPYFNLGAFQFRSWWLA